MKKSILYIGLIIILLVANLFILFFPKGSNPSNASKFYLEGYDFSTLESISFTSKDHSTTMSKQGDQWVLNDSMKIDQGFFSTLVSILERVEVTRQLNGLEEQMLGEITVMLAGRPHRFQYASNSNRTKSYFIDGDRVCEVAVPGYRDNVVDIFELHPDQWRDRLILDGSWRTIQKVKVESSRGNEFEVAFQDKFFTVNNLQPRDSSAVVDYLSQYQYFQANEVISTGRFPRLDSLMSTKYQATITIDDINLGKPLIINIYPRLKNQNYHLVTSGDKMMVIDQKRVSALLASP